MKKLFKSFGFAINGILIVSKSETNMKIHLAISLMVLIAGFFLDISCTEWIACIICMGLVTFAEMTNTAIEKIVNFISPDIHPMAGMIKDIAAGAVLLSALAAATVGVIIFLPKIANLF